MKRYIVRVDGFDSHEIFAETAGKAKYQEYLAIREAYDGIRFQDFLRCVSVLHKGPVSPLPGGLE